MLRFAAGQAATLPYRFLVHLVAARYGQSPAAVRAWPARDFLEAIDALPVTEPRARPEAD